MYELKESNRPVWDFFAQGKFSVHKSTTPFTALGADHALEQVNKTIKSHGGIKGIANKQNSLDHHFIVAPELTNIIEKFRLFFGIEDLVEQEEHYQLRGGKNVRIMTNMDKLLTVFKSHDTNFDDSDNVYNILTKRILPKQYCDEFLQHEEIGKKRFNEFIKERFERETSIWSPVTKTKLPTFALNVKKKQVEFNNTIVTIKEERKLMSRLIIAAKSRPNVDLSNYFGGYEFSVVSHPSTSLHPEPSLLHRAFTSQTPVSFPAVSAQQ